MTDPRRLVLVAALAITGPGVDSAQVPVKGQPGFRVRSDFSAPLNSDQGWTGAINEDVTIQADRPFRIRFELEGAAGSAGSHQFRLSTGGIRATGPTWRPTTSRSLIQTGRGRRASARSRARRIGMARQPRIFWRAPAPQRRDGVRVHGYVYDAGSNGGAGMNRFDQVVLRPY